MKKAIIPAIVFLLLASLLVVAAPAQADFANVPSFQVTQSDYAEGANGVIVYIKLTIPANAGDYVKGIKITIPQGYRPDPSKFTSNALLGTIQVKDGPLTFDLQVRAVGEVGNRADVLWVVGPFKFKVGEIILNFITRELTLDVHRNYGLAVDEATLTTIPGLLNNPLADGNYNWTGKALARTSSWQDMTPSVVAITPVVLPKMHVASIDLSYTTWWLFFLFLRGDVKIVDASDTPVAGARVVVQWTGPDSRMQGAFTAANGIVRFSPFMRYRPGLRTLTVMGVTKPGFEYNPAANVETFDTIFVL